MTSDADKWIRSVRDNSAGKVVADPDGNRWEWQSNDETAAQLKKLENPELAIEHTDIHPALRGDKASAARPAPAKAEPSKVSAKPGRDVGGGFNPYDNPGKSRRR